MVGAVGIEPGDDFGGLVVEGDDDLAAVRADEVVDGTAGAFEFEGDCIARRGAFVQGGHALGPAFAEFVGPGIKEGESPGELGLSDGEELGSLVVCGDEGFLQGVWTCGLGGGFDGFQGADDGGEIELVAGVHMRMHTVRCEDEFVAETFLFVVGFWQRGLPDELALFGQFRHFHAHMNSGDAIVVGNFFHGAGGALEGAFDHGRGQGLCEGIDKADVAVWIRMPGLADDTLHALVDLVRGRAAIVHCELDEEQVWLVIQHVLF